MPAGRSAVRLDSVKRVSVLLFALVLALPTDAADWSGSPVLDRIVEEAVTDGTTPGAVLLVGRDDTILHEAAYGNRSLVPTEEPMSVDTVFDAASLTKVVVTASVSMCLVHRGLLALADPVKKYLPRFHGAGRDSVTIELVNDKRHVLLVRVPLRDKPLHRFEPLGLGADHDLYIACSDREASDMAAIARAWLPSSLISREVRV